MRHLLLGIATLAALLTHASAGEPSTKATSEPPPHARVAQATAAELGKHLFILSGQSNMKKLNPDISFTPTVEAAFGKEKVIVVKDAQNGKPIALWYKAWKSPAGHPPNAVGGLYNRLMGSVKAAIDGRNIKTVTFVWMQGESDTKPDVSGDYEAGLKGLIEHLRKDMGRQDINVVIGRLSDFQTENENADWMVVRKAQMAVAEADPRGAWVDTDDLNDDKGTVGAEGRMIKDVHYTADGFRLLGERFAKKAIELIKKPTHSSAAKSIQRAGSRRACSSLADAHWCRS